LIATIKGEISAFREGELARLVLFPTFRRSLEKAFSNLKLARVETDPTTNFWNAYKQVADEYDNDLVSKYVGDLDTSLLFVSAFTSLIHPINSNQSLLVF